MGYRPDHERYHKHGPSTDDEPVRMAHPDPDARTRTAVQFVLGDDLRVWPGYSTGLEWNGFDEVLVTPATRDALIDYVGPDTEQADDLRTMPLTDDGLVDTVGWQTCILDPWDAADDAETASLSWPRALRNAAAWRTERARAYGQPVRVRGLALDARALEGLAADFGIVPDPRRVLAAFDSENARRAAMIAYQWRTR